MPESDAGWVAIALPFLEDLWQYNPSAELTLFLSDAQGCLTTLVGGGSARQPLQPGSLLTEEWVGTTAPGMALITAMPVQVVGAEHYHPRLFEVATTAAPVHTAGGILLGLVGCITPAAAASPSHLAMIAAAARAIAAQHDAETLFAEGHDRLTRLHTIVDAAPDGVLMWHPDGRIHHCNLTAARMIGLSRSGIVGMQIAHLIKWPLDVEAALQRGMPITNREALLQANRRRITCLLTLKPLYSGASRLHDGAVAFLRPIEQVRSVISQQTGTTASFSLADINTVLPVMHQLLGRIRTISRNSLPVLFSGEIGVGKSYLAQTLHNAGPRAQKPFVRVNCRATARPLLQREIFGLAATRKQGGVPGKFELANGGTLLINQVQLLPAELQVALLELIDRRRIVRLGSDQPVAVNVRLIVTTPPHPDRLVEDGLLQEELYYRLYPTHLEVPPLRERSADIPLLATQILAILRPDQPPPLTAEALHALTSYSWPGNIRELEMALEQALSRNPDSPIVPADLPLAVRRGGSAPFSADSPVRSLDEVEREAIVQIGRMCNGVTTRMAQELGISRTTLWRKMKAWNITSADLRKS
jgi:transcriptional activator for dhaKLM operon